MKQIAALPALLTGYPGPDELFDAREADYRSEFSRGRQFLERDPARVIRLVTYGRLACLPLSLIGLLVAMAWARELYGAFAGLTAGLLWCGSPTVLGHAPLITADAAATSLGLLTCYTFWRFLRNSEWNNVLMVGATFGVCLLTKTLWIALFALLPMMLLMWQRIRSRRKPTEDQLDATQTVYAPWGKLLLIFCMAFAILNLGYGFAGFGRRLGDFRFRSTALSGQPIDSPTLGNRFRGTWAAAIPVPLPADFVRGIDLQRRDFEIYPASYLRGKWSQDGWWYYYLYALGVKETVGFLLLLVTAIALSSFVSAFRTKLLDELALVVPCIATLVFVSSQTKMNHHFRYVLPALPYLFIFSAKAFAANVPCPAALRGWTYLLLVWAFVSAFSFFPYTIAYFNELAGGPANGWRHLHDSNTDWSQGMFALKEWQQRHPERSPLYLARWRHGLDPRVVGVNYLQMAPDNRGANVASFHGLPDGPVPGWHVISTNEIIEDDYRYLRELTPTESIVGCYLVYYVTPEFANRVRKEAGAPLIEEPEAIAR